jgi:hypothetical protein
MKKAITAGILIGGTIGGSLSGGLLSFSLLSIFLSGVGAIVGVFAAYYLVQYFGP